jgi:hypothetical protein
VKPLPIVAAGSTCRLESEEPDARTRGKGCDVVSRIYGVDPHATPARVREQQVYHPWRPRVRNDVDYPPPNVIGHSFGVRGKTSPPRGRGFTVRGAYVAN